MRIALVGRHQTLHAAGRLLLDQGHTLGAVVTASAAPEYTVGPDDFRALAREAGCPFFEARSLAAEDLRAALSGLDLAVSVNWVSVLREQDVALFRLGVLNAHLGDLPRYRGNACPNWAILQGEPRVTLTAHLMEGGRLDCGPILAREHLDLTDGTYIGEICAWSEEATPRTLARAVQSLDEDPGRVLAYAAHDDPAGFRCYPRVPEDSLIDWTRNAVDIHRLVRASSAPFAGAYTHVPQDGVPRRMHVLRAGVHAEDTPDLAAPGQLLRNDPGDGSSLVMCGRGVLRLESCRWEDGTEFAPGAYFRSIRMRLGLRLEDLLALLREGGA